MSIESNFGEFIKKQRQLMADLSSDKILRQAAFDSVVLISDRVQQRGENVSGQKMRNKKKGVYSKYYAKKRAKEGRQTDYVDLTMTGDMMDNLIPQANGDGQYIVGFAGKSASDKAEYSELYYGSIFQLSEQEQSQVFKQITDSTNEAIRRYSI